MNDKLSESQNKNILIVEDSVDLQILLGQLFKRAGYTVTQAYNGQQALLILSEMPKKPSVILLDIMMPVMDGIEFRKHQINDPVLAHIPVMVMTADSEPAKRASQMQVVHYFEKPIKSIDQLLRVASTLSA